MTSTYTLTLTFTNEQVSIKESEDFSVEARRDNDLAIWELSRGRHKLVAFTSPDYDIDPLVADFQVDPSTLVGKAATSYRELSLALLEGERLVFASSDSNGMHPIYYVKGDNRLYLGLSPAVLARIANRGIDHRVIATYVLSLENFYPFYDLTPWMGVRRLNPLKVLKGRPSGEIKVFDKVEIGSPVGTIEELAKPLQIRMDMVMGELIAGKDNISSDLSGGLDSTSLCFWANEKVDHLQTLFLTTNTKENTDYLWARQASDILGSAHHEWFYHDVALSPQIEPNVLTKAMPFAFSEAYRYISLVPHIEDLCLEESIGVHINGHAGDELFGPNAALPWSFYRSDAPKKRRVLTSFAHVNKLPMRQFWQDVLDETAFSTSLASITFAQNSHDAVKELSRSHWLPLVAAPEFSTPDAMHLVGELAKQLADDEARPLSEDRSQHQIFESLQCHQLLNSSLNLQVKNKEEFRFSSPFLDLEVIDIATQLRAEDRFMSPGPKELLHRARHPSMPSTFFQRWDKGEYSRESFTLFANHKEVIRVLFSQQSVLAELGLVDATLVLDNLERFSPNGESLEQLMRIEVLEKWLRGLFAQEKREGVFR